MGRGVEPLALEIQRSEGVSGVPRWKELGTVPGLGKFLIDATIFVIVFAFRIGSFVRETPCRIFSDSSFYFLSLFGTFPIFFCLLNYL